MNSSLIALQHPYFSA